MNAEILDLLKLMRREIWEKRRVFAVVYLCTSILFLAMGWFWPKVYMSSSTILVDQQNILQPLMQGTTVTTEVHDRAKLAREVIFSRKAMSEVLEKSGWSLESLTGLEKERIIANIEGASRISSAGPNLLRINFQDADPEHAYTVAKNLTDVFIDQSLLAKQKESREAFEFIDRQVKQYLAKLQAAEKALEVFNSANFDARPGSKDEVSTRIRTLRDRMDATSLELRELKIQNETLKKQLSGEAAITENLTREGQYRQRLVGLEEQLADARLQFFDAHPDIVKIKTQITSIEQSLLAEQRRSALTIEGGGVSGVSGAATTSLLYQELRSQLANTETKLASLNARRDETRKLLAKEEDRIIRINGVEAQLAELTRDYQTNEGVYQDLSRNREAARISMNIDKENQGLTFKVQEPAVLPLTPLGVRLMHFMAAGFVLSFAFPIGLIFGLTLIDQKVRSSRVVSEALGLPVLATVYNMDTPTEYSIHTFKKSVILLAILLSWGLYGYAAWLRVNS